MIADRARAMMAITGGEIPELEVRGAFSGSGEICRSGGFLSISIREGMRKFSVTARSA